MDTTELELEILELEEKMKATRNPVVKSDAESMQIKWDLMDDNLESEFLAKFKPLFLKIVNPTVPLWYISENN